METLIERPISIAEIVGCTDGIFGDIYLSLTGRFNRDGKNRLLQEVFKNTVFLLEKISAGYSTETPNQFTIRDAQSGHQIEISRSGGGISLQRMYQSLKKNIPISEKVSLRRTFDTSGVSRFLGDYTKVEQEKQFQVELFG